MLSLNLQKNFQHGNIVWHFTVITTIQLDFTIAEDVRKMGSLIISLRDEVRELKVMLTGRETTGDTPRFKSLEELLQFELSQDEWKEMVRLNLQVP